MYGDAYQQLKNQYDLKLKGLEEDIILGTDKVYSGAEETQHAGNRHPQGISSANNMFCQNKRRQQMKWYKKIGLLATTGLAVWGSVPAPTMEKICGWRSDHRISTRK